MKTMMLLILMVIGNFSYAGGLMSVSGQMVSCDDEICKVKIDKAQIYQISLKKLSLLQKRELSAKKKGDMVSTAIPMNAIVRVDDVKK